MSFQLWIGVIASFWLLSLVAGGVALRWSFLSAPGRFWPAIILSLLAIVIGYLGMTRFHLVYAKTVNGQSQWRFDSKWFFMVTLLLGTVALTYTIWKRQRSPKEGLPQRGMLS